MKKIRWLPSQQDSHNRWVVFSSLLMGVLLDSISWSGDWGVAIPDVTPLILLYWVMAIATNNFLVTAFFFGLLHDVLYHTGMGTYALIYCFLLYPMLHLRLQIRNKTLVQMSLFIGVWMLAHQVLVWLITPANHLAMENIAFWFAIPISILLWSFIFLSLRVLRRNMNVR